jgi:hypothetical protein
MITTPIQCNCGAVRMELTGEPLVQLYCHCDDCQAVHCAAYIPAVMYRIPETRIVSGDLRMWALKTTARATCRECGTPIFSEPPGLGIRAIRAHLLPKGMFKPTFHMNCQYAMLPVKDDLPHYKGFPAMFGGSDEQVPW